MKIIASDGIGVRALLAVAEKLCELTEERNITLGVIEDGGDGHPVGVVVGNTIGKGPRLGVTIERNPRIVDLDAPEPLPEGVARVHSYAGHFYAGTRDCMCVNRCCNDDHDMCVCTECEDIDHEHKGRADG